MSVAAMHRKLGRPATRADLEALPPELKGEIIDRELYVEPRPRARHARVEGVILVSTQGPYDLGQGGPGGWWILPEPGIELPGSPEFSPDVAGWRRERLPELPEAEPIRVAPDWVCEMLSPGTRGYDSIKMATTSACGCNPSPTSSSISRSGGSAARSVDAFHPDRA